MGSEDDEGYVLHQGTADVMMGPVKVFTLKAGMSFGTVGMISGEPRTASIVAREPCLVWYITRKKFEAFQSADGQVAAALQIVAELRQTNMRNVYKSSLSISFLRTFGSLLGVESEMIQSFIEASAPLVAKTGATLCASSRKSRRLFSMSRVAGAAALSLQQQQLLQPMYLLRGTVRIILEEPVNASGMSYEEQAAYLADLPLPPKLLAQQKATSDISSILPEQRLIVQCGSRSELEAKLNGCINTSSFGADVSTSLLSLGGGGGGNDDGEARKGSVVFAGSRCSDMCHWVDVHGPAFINLANQFLTDISFGHFEIVALSPCDLFTLKREHLINQDVLELAVLRNNCAQIHCRFIPTLSKPMLQRVFLRSIHEVPTKEYFNGVTAIHDLDGVEQWRGVFSKNDVISFGGPRDDPNAVYIIVSGELEHVDGRLSSATKPPLTGGGSTENGRGGGGTAAATPKSNHSSKSKSSSGGVPSLQQCFIWPDLPVVYFGCLPATAKALTRVDVIRIRRSDVIRVLAASCDENALGQLTNLLATAFTSKYAKQPTFVEPLSLAVRRGSRTSRGGGADGGTSSSNNRCDDAAAERGALKRVQSIRIATQRFARTHVPLSLDAEREEAIASGAVTQVLRDSRRPPPATDGHVTSPNRKTSSNVFEDVPMVADPVNTNNEPTAAATGHQQHRGVPGLPRAPLPSPHQNAIQVLQQPQRTTHPSDTHPATATPAAPSSMMMTSSGGAKPLRGGGSSSNNSSSLVTGSFGAMFVVPGSISPRRESSFDRASPSCGRLVLDEALPFSYSYESQVPTPKRTPANEFLRSRVAGAAGSSSSAQHLAKRTSTLRTSSNPLHSGESSGQFDADVDSNNGWQSSGSLKNSCEVSLSSVRSITLQPPSSNHAKVGRHQRRLGKGRAGGGVDCEQDDDEDDSTVDQARLASLLDVLRHEQRDHDSSVSHGSGSSRDASPARGYSSGGGGSAVVYQPVVHRMVIQRRPTTSGGKGASPVTAPQHATTARSSTPLIPSGDQNINDRRNRPPPPPASGSSSARTGTTPHSSPTSANPRWRQYEHQQKNQSSTSSLHSSLSSPVTRSGGRGDSAPSSSPATSHSVQNERTKLLARASRQLAKRKELLQ